MVSSLLSVLQHPDRQVAPPFIHAVALRLMEHLTAVAGQAPGAALRGDDQDAALTLLLQELVVMDTLLALAQDDKREMFMRTPKSGSFLLLF